MANMRQEGTSQEELFMDAEMLLEPNPHSLWEERGQERVPVMQGQRHRGEAGGQRAFCYELTLPAGMTLSEAQQAIFEEQARELGLSNVSAQKLLEISHRNALAHRQAHKKQVMHWAEQVREDKELGGPATETTLTYAKAGLARFDPERQLFGILQETGYANHPQVIRFLAAIGKAHAEDEVFLGGAAPAQTPRHERLYGKYNK